MIHPTKKQVLRIVSLLIALVLLASCAPVQGVPVTTLEKLSNDLAGGGRTKSITVGTLQFSHECSTPYDTSKWRVTDTKILSCNLRVVEAGKDVKILVTHIHVDTSLISTEEQINGMSIDSMDDKLSSGTLPGVLVDAKHPYPLIFSIEGYTKDLIDGWAFVNGSGGTGHITQSRLTEENLLTYGKVYGQKFTYVYKLLVSDNGKDEYYAISFADEFYVPVGKQPVPSAPSAVPTMKPQ